MSADRKRAHPYDEREIEEEKEDGEPSLHKYLEEEERGCQLVEEDGQRSKRPALNGESGGVTMRALLTAKEAGAIIGKNGQSINQIRELSSARIIVSPMTPGINERIISISGMVNECGNAFLLCIQRIKSEDKSFVNIGGYGKQEGNEGEESLITIKLLMPNSRIGLIIGKSGKQVKEIQMKSKSRVIVSDSLLLNSTERLVTIISSVAENVKTAIMLIGRFLNSNTVLNNIPYRPIPRFSNYINTMANTNVMVLSNNLLQTQQILIPNDRIGSVIGKGGLRINQIRQYTGALIKIDDDPGVAVSNRLVTITGTAEANALAVYLLYSCLERNQHRLAKISSPGSAALLE